jgi:peptidoglycan/xylan/chitin deacetylase (PgdA/CDA1 family)
MSQRFLIFIAACFYYSGLVALFRWWQRHFTDSLIILGYHQASGGDLRRHLSYLKRHYHIVHLEQALSDLYNPHRQHTPRISLAITFDDGYRDNYAVGFPLAQEMHIPITLFLATGYIDSGNPFWWQEEHLIAEQKGQRIHLCGRIYHLDNREELEDLKHEFDYHVFYASSVAQRETFLKKLHMLISSSRRKESATFSWSEAQEMQQSGLVSFGAHTVNHPVLAYLADMQELTHEVYDCRTEIEKRLGPRVRCFAYPIGGLEHIGPKSLYMVKRAGYDWAVTVVEGFNTPETDPHLLHRFVVDVNQHWLLIAAKTCGVWGFFTSIYRFPKKLIDRL